MGVLFDHINKERDRDVSAKYIKFENICIDAIGRINEPWMRQYIAKCGMMVALALGAYVAEKEEPDKQMLANALYQLLFELSAKFEHVGNGNRG